MLFFILAALIVLVDRISKIWIASSLEPGQAVRLIPGVLRLTYVENTGAAFSLLADKRWLLVAVSSVAVIGLIVLVVLYRDGEIGRLGACFILGGAVGNLVDRIATGSVVDMFEPEFVNFAIFNIADIFITVGGAIFILHIISLSLKTRRAKQLAAEQSVAARRHVRVVPNDDDMPGPDLSVTFTEEQILEEYDIVRQMESDDDISG